MTPHNCLYLIAAVLAVIGGGALGYAADDVTVISTPAAATAPAQKPVAQDGTPVVHKSLHKKKQAATATASGAGAPSGPTSPVTSATLASTANKPVTKLVTTDVAPTTHPQPAVATTTAQSPAATATAHPQPVAATTTAQSPAATTTTHSQPAVATTTARPQSLVPTNTAPPAPAASAKSAPVSNPAPPGPTVETGLPVARYPGMGGPIKGVSTYIPTTVTQPSAKSVTGTATHQSYFASTVRPSVVPLTSSSAGSFSSPSPPTKPSSDFVFTNYSKKAKATYPWKMDIITTMFWIGEGGSNVSSTDNIQSSWDQDWLPNNHGSDSPNNRNGYAAGNHASTLNPFYVALPFNDLVFPDKARQWLPRGWYRPPKDGKQVSACKDRWVEIKNAQGRTCYAQWEDVGPLRYDHAEYVFGNERPIGVGDDHAGLDVSPAVAQYLGIDGKNRITSWRFVDDEDVRPGDWLRLDEQAVIFKAMLQMKSTSLPIQKATEPVNDSDSNKKKVDASKG